MNSARISPSSDNRWPRFVGCVMAVAAVLLIIKACTTGLTSDELLFVRAIDLGLVGGLCEPGSSHPPLMRIVIGLVACGSSPDWQLRLPSIVLSVLTVAVWGQILPGLISSRSVRRLLLAAMALNPIWLNLGFQCLPYAALTFFASLHCLCWFRAVERSELMRWGMLVLSGAVLPWTHFLGINVLLADLFIWAVFVTRQRIPFSIAVRANLVTAGLTLAVVPIALFYIRNDRPCPLMQIDDFSHYFALASALIFSDLTFSLMTAQPLYLVLYAAVFVFVLQTLRGDLRNPHLTPEADDHCRAVGNSRDDPAYGIVMTGVLLSGFVAAQIHSLVSQTATWPRYMMAGAWGHLPLIVLLLQFFRCQRAGILLSVGVLAATIYSSATQPLAGTVDYADVARKIRSNWREGDAFLAQSMDLWAGDSHFDELWFRRYVGASRPVVSGAFTSRADLYRDGLLMNTIGPSVQRVWVYSHLFRREWIEQASIPGWRIAGMYQAAERFPLVLLQRTSAAQATAASEYSLSEDIRL